MIILCNRFIKWWYQYKKKSVFAFPIWAVAWENFSHCIIPVLLCLPLIINVSNNLFLSVSNCLSSKTNNFHSAYSSFKYLKFLASNPDDLHWSCSLNVGQKI